MKITVLGSGGWGTALALLLLRNGHQVTLWSYLDSESANLREKRENPVLPGVTLPPELELTADMSCVKGCPVVVLAPPSFAVRSTATKAGALMDEGTVIVSVSKGIEENTSLTLTEVIAQATGDRFPIAALSGPSHAEEVARGVPTSVVAAAKDRHIAELVQDLFMGPAFRVYTTDDVVGVELAAALKNIIALCAGICDGLGFGDNTMAALMTRGLAEMARLGHAMGGRRETFAGLAGVGDLMVTCTSQHSRNRRCGVLIGQGALPQQAVREVGMVVEGYYACAAAKTLADKLGVEMPISQAVWRVLYRGKDPKTAAMELMAREKKAEHDGIWD